MYKMYAIRIDDYNGKPWFLFYMRDTGDFTGNGHIFQKVVPELL